MVGIATCDPGATREPPSSGGRMFGVPRLATVRDDLGAGGIRRTTAARPCESVLRLSAGGFCRHAISALGSRSYLP